MRFFIYKGYEVCVTGLFFKSYFFDDKIFKSEQDVKDYIDNKPTITVYYGTF